jgi:hypothetical protein
MDEEPQNVFRDLPPEIRAFALAGHYLSSFAIMESNLNAAIGAGLRLGELQTLIVTKNIQFRDKQKIIRTLTNIAFIPDETKAAYDRTLIRMGDMSNDRNMVAHDLFFADEDGDGIEFIVTKAHGTIKFPETKWSVDDVEERSMELLATSDRLKALKEDFKRSDQLLALAKAPPQWINALMTTNAGLWSQEFSGPVPLRPPSDPNSAPQETTDAKSPETPKEPPE